MLRPSPGTADSPRGSRTFLAACALIAVALLATCVWLAHGEYFFGDDFIFLRHAQLPRDWRHVLVPLGQRGWWSYRPLSIEVFFSAMYRLARLDAFFYLLVSVLVHFANGALVYRLAIQLELDRRVALFAGVLSVAMYPSLNGELFWVSAFQTVSGCFFYLLCLTIFVDYLTTRRRVLQAAATAAMGAALLCNELGMTIPGPAVLLAIFFARGSVASRARRALLDAAPLLLVLAVYVPFRYLVIGPSVLPTPALNLPHLGWHIPLNAALFVHMLLKTSRALEVVCGAIVVAGWLAAARSREGALGRLAARSALLVGWLLAAMVPFVPAFFVPHRAAMDLEAPFCLLLAAHLDPLVRAAAGASARRLAEVGLVALLLAAIPYAVIAEQAGAPRGAVNRDLIKILERDAPALPTGACVRLVTRPEDAWTAGEIYALGFRTSGVLTVAYPGRHLELPPQPGQAPAARAGCVERFDVALLRGPAASRPNFALRAIGRAPP